LVIELHHVEKYFKSAAMEYHILKSIDPEKIGLTKQQITFTNFSEE